jgi:hypothetical protein
MMNLELVRLIKYEMTDEFLEEYKNSVISTARTKGANGDLIDLGVNIIDQLYMVPEEELPEWFLEREGSDWETIFYAMINGIRHCISTKQSEEGEWILENPII